MLVKEYFNVVREVWFKIRGPYKFELLFIKTSLKQYIKEFNLKKYLKRIIFQENILLNIFLLFFIFRIIYDFFNFIFYTIDLYFTFLFKWIFYIIYFSLDKWETYIFKKIYEVRKDPVKSKIYKREKALLAKSRAKFFKRFAIDFEKEYDICLKFSKRDYSIIYKYYKYFSILIPSFFKWFRFSIRTNIPYLWKRFNIWISKVLIKDYVWNWSAYMQLAVLRFFFKFLKFSWKSYYFIRDIVIEIIYFLKRRLNIYYVAYKIRKKNRLQFYRFLYINYFFFNKKRTLNQNKIIKLSEKDLNKYTNEAISFTFNFYSFNLKFIYFWHCYIKKIKYISYLEYWWINSKNYNYDLENNFKDCGILIPFSIVFFLTRLSKFLVYIIPIFNKYYVKYMTIIRNYFFKYIYELVSFLTYIIAPFVFVFCLYKNIKEFYKYFSLFIKILFKKSK